MRLIVVLLVVALLIAIPVVVGIAAEIVALARPSRTITLDATAPASPQAIAAACTASLRAPPSAR